MRSALIGTAGHIDHGKTSLVKALTGIDCDRWAEEKTRGITIDLGFAHLLTEYQGAPLQLGFVDVPGHERFLHNALAGLPGIRVLLLVVAADEGVKPQTREHLAICSLLGIPTAVVALTKADLVDADLLELARLELDELLAPTPFAKAPVIAVSAHTGQGLEELRQALCERAARQSSGRGSEVADAPARLPIDRAFHLKGQGVVVTGTLAAGRIATGDTLEVLPAGGASTPVRVRSVQVHGASREQAVAGERTALQLAGVDLDRLERGQQVVASGAYLATLRLLVDLELLPDAAAAITGSTPVRVHLLAGEALGRVRPLGRAALAPGERGPVEIRLATPLVAVRGDRVILRRPSPEATLGGGQVLDPKPAPRRARDLDAVLTALAPGPGETERLLGLWVRQAGGAGLDAPGAAARLGVAVGRAAAELARLTAAGKVLAIPEAPGQRARWVSAATVKELADRARRVLTTHHEKDRLSRGMPKAEAVRRIFPGRARELADVYLGWLAGQKVLTQDGALVTLPGRGGELTQDESALATAVLARFEAAGLTPDSPAALTQDLSPKPQILEGIVRYLADRGQLVRLPGGLFLASTAFQQLRRDLLATGWERFSVGTFKDHFGLSRKWAIPLLEQLDSTGATRRAGDDRLVVRSSRNEK